MKKPASRGTRRGSHDSTRRRLERPTAGPISPASGGEPTGIPYRPSLPASLRAPIRRRDAVAAPLRRLPLSPPDPNSPPVAAFWDIGTNLKDGLPLTPWAAEIKKQRMAINSVNNPDANCLPLGIHPLHTHPDPRQIIQTPKLLTIAYESNYGLRFIHTDGRKVPPLGEPQPWWYGYSAGRWEGDTLVVETNNVRGAEMGTFDGWLDVNGSPHSNEVKFTERFRRPTFGKLEIDLTIEDPKAYTKPFTVRINQEVMVDNELIEFICNENQQFRRRVKVD